MNAADHREKRRESRSWLYGTSEIIVRPGSPDRFIEATRRMRGTYMRSVNSKRGWIAINLSLDSLLFLMSIVTVWFSDVYGHAMWIGILLVLMYFAIFARQLWIFIWTMTPPSSRAKEEIDRI